MYSKSPKIFNFLLLSFLLYFIQISVCEVESNDKRFFSPSSHNNIEKRAPSPLETIQYICKLTNNWRIFFFFLSSLTFLFYK